MEVTNLKNKTMKEVMFALAMLFFVATILVGSDTIKFKSEWKSVAVTYSLLAAGVLCFAGVLTY